MSDVCADCNSKMKGIWAGYPPSKNDPTICEQCAYNREVSARKSMTPGELQSELEAEQADRERRAKAETLAHGVLVSTTEQVFGRRITGHLGIARGGTARAKNAISDFGAGIKNLVGGELVAYTQLMADAREQALHRMKIDAVMLKAHAVVGVSFSTSMIDVGVSEITAIGTAVTLAEEDEGE